MSGRYVMNWKRAGAYAAAAAGLLPTTAAPAHAAKTHLVYGGCKEIGRCWVTTWARVDSHGAIQAVGFTLPYGLVTSPPARPGDGPAGSVAVLPFPGNVQASTYFNHFELHWNPKGHRPACYMIPHYDFHFYGVPVADVRKVGLKDTAAPDKAHLAAGYVYPGPALCIPEMGVHAAPPMDMSPGHAFTATMIAGYYHGQMTFVEPMVTRTWLMRRQSFTLAVPRPAVLGRRTLYPTRFAALYDRRNRAYRFVFSGFETTSADAAAPTASAE